MFEHGTDPAPQRSREGAGGPEELPEPARARVKALDERIAQVSANVDAGLAELVDLVGEFDALEGWGDQAAASFPTWLAWRANVAPHFASELLRVSKALDNLPEVKAALHGGRITFWQARTIARVAQPDTQGMLLYLADNCTAAQLQRICGAYARCERLRAGHEDKRGSRMLGYHYDDDGFMEGYWRLCPEDAALFEKALEATAERLRKEQEANSATDRTYGQRSADALVEMARVSLARAGDDGDTAAPGYEVMVHVDLDTLASGGDGPCHLEGGPALAPQVIERILCDSFVTAAVEKDGVVIDVSKRRRTASARQRKALLARDKMCSVPGCTHRAHLQAHHIRYYTPEHGETSPDNLTLLCWLHHPMVHAGEIKIERRDDGTLIFFDRHGKVIEPVPDKARGSVVALFADNESRGLELDSETARSGWDGDPVSLGNCIDAIYSATKEPEETPSDPGRAPPDPGAPPDQDQVA